MANESSESSSLLPKDVIIPTSYSSKKPLKELRPEPIETPEAEDEDLNDPSLTRVVSEGRKAQYAGNTALRKQMPYMLPALAIGIFLSAADQTIIVSSYGKIGSDLNALSSTSWIATVCSKEFCNSKERFIDYLILGVLPDLDLFPTALRQTF